MLVIGADGDTKTNNLPPVRIADVVFSANVGQLPTSPTLDAGSVMEVLITGRVVWTGDDSLRSLAEGCSECWWGVGVLSLALASALP